MDSQEFHERIVNLFKDGLAKWDWNHNPLEWEGIPAAVEGLHRQMLEAGLRPDAFGGPIRVGQEWDNDDEAVISAQIPLMADCDDYVGFKELLSDALIRDCKECDQGHRLAEHIAAIEVSLQVARQKAEALGWGVPPSQNPQ